MILIDFNQVMLGGLLKQINNKSNFLSEEALLRHTVLNKLRFNINQFKDEYGDVVICCDNRKYWRKEVFPFYKASRKKNRDKSDLNWNMLFDMLSKFKQELKDNFPYKLIDVENAEADDIIGTLVEKYANDEKIIIISSDGDFLQLQKYPNVKQFNPTLKNFVHSENPLLELKEKIIRGDRGDGIPNVLSPSDSFVREIKQKSITKSILEKFLNEKYSDWSDETARSRFERNQTLIDLSKIPDDIKQKIINNFNEAKPASKQKMFNYFVEFKLTALLEVIDEF